MLLRSRFDLHFVGGLNPPGPAFTLAFFIYVAESHWLSAIEEGVHNMRACQLQHVHAQSVYNFDNNKRKSGREK